MFSKALVTTIENNTENKNSKFLGIERKYFDEAVKCFKSWEKYHPEVQKYAICPTKATLNKDEIKQLEELNVVYIEKYFEELEECDNGFINVSLSISYLENVLNEDIFIHTDLDMVLIKKLPDDLFLIEKNDVICGKYDDESRKCQRVDFDTGFTIHFRNNKFYNEYWTIIKNIIDGKIPLPPGVLYYDIEEYAMEYISKTNKKYNILPIEKYQLGEGYPSIDLFSNNDLRKVYFWHEHLVNDKKEELVKEKIKLFKRLKEVEKPQ